MKSVAIVAMGASSAAYLGLAAAMGTRYRVANEVWAINSMGGIIQHDLLFHMDDCKIQESRAKRDPDSNVAGMLHWLKAHPNFMTSRVYDDYPGAAEFPLEDVINKLGHAYFNNTVSYALAFAIYREFEKIHLYGCDFTYPDAHKAEAGRACVEFWCGMAVARGIHIEVTNQTTLLDASVPEERRFYGYDTENISLSLSDGKLKVTRGPREKIPSADEIEARYNNINTRAPMHLVEQ